jgi:rhodanese-related sulfurtransferase
MAQRTDSYQPGLLSTEADTLAGMKRLLPLIAFALASSAQDDVKKITPEELQDMLGKRVFFLDVRSPKEIEELGTVKGYVNIPIEDLEKRMDEVPKDRKVITACNAGGRASRAAAMLKAKGYDVVGACGLRDAKDKGIELIYPKAKSNGK